MTQQPPTGSPVAKPAAEKLVRAGLLLYAGGGEDLEKAVATMTDEAPRQRHYLSRDEFAAAYGAAPEAVKEVEAFAERHRLKVVEVNREGRLVILEATIERFEKAFGCEFEGAEVDGDQFHRPAEDVPVPAELRKVVEDIFGFDNRPCFSPHSQGTHLSPSSGGTAGQSGTAVHPVVHHAARAAAEGTPPAEVVRRYNFPPQTGNGQTIAIVLLGGGFYERDMREFFGADMPRIKVVGIGGATNDPTPWPILEKALKGQSPTDPKLAAQLNWTLEATVDVQLVGSFAPDAEIVVYFAPNNELGKIEAFTRILTDRKNRPSVVSCSWSSSEADRDERYVTAVDRIFCFAAWRGVSVCYSSGDHGPNVQDGKPTAQFPASSPHVLACGGTTLLVADPGQPESAWREQVHSSTLATGGGFSRFFRRPAWQRGVPDAKPGQAWHAGAWRGVPDVAAKADFGTGYALVLGGVTRPFGGGTSSAAPLWASLLARCNEALGLDLGWVTPLFYRKGVAASLNDIVHGTNGLFPAVKGWDAATGWGTPDGKALLRALEQA